MVGDRRRKRCLCTAVLLALLAGCGEVPGTAVGDEVEREVGADTGAGGDVALEAGADALRAEEWERAQAYGLVTADFLEERQQAIRFSEFFALLAEVVNCVDPSMTAQWEILAKEGMDRDSVMERDDGMLAVYEAACVLGLGGLERGNWNEVHQVLESLGLEEGYDPDRTVFANCLDASPFEDVPGRVAGWDYLTGAQFYALGQSSVIQPQPLFDYPDEEIAYDDPLTRGEAVSAAWRLLESAQLLTAGGWSLQDTDWDDPLLADAAKARDAILNSETAVRAAEELVLGETYTGTAYYVSPGGSDANSGKSPEDAWASLEKVAQASLQYGDAVFFERGGSWYGNLSMQYGVTYSAYGEGDKPLITGSPLDAHDAKRWELFGQTSDGGLIWVYAEETLDCGVILLNGGQIVARKAYPSWDGERYIDGDKTAFDPLEGLYADQMFFSETDLTGYSLPADVWPLSRKGPLYMRCDAGNPGEVFEKIELALLPEATTVQEGWNAVDNLHFRCYSSTGMDCCGNNNVVYQNCEVDWCGGAVQHYTDEGEGKVGITVSGGGLLLFGSDVTGRNNYIHDCENKGIAVVINNAGSEEGAITERVNVLAQGNVVERCGCGIYLWVGNVKPQDQWRYENVVFSDNAFLDSGYGWRQQNLLFLTEKNGPCVNSNDVFATGEVLLENNLFYRATGALISALGTDLEGGEAVLPTMQGNVYVQDAGQLLFLKRDEVHDLYPETTQASDDERRMDTCVREYLGDAAGTAIPRQTGG